MRTSPWTRGAFVVAVALAAVFALALFEIQRMPARSQQFPLATALPGLVLALLAIVHELRHPPPALPPDAAMTLRAAAWFGGYFGATFLVGFAPTTVLFTAVYLRREAELPWVVALAGAVAGTVGEVIFANTLHVPLPEGLLAPLLPRIGG